MPELAQYLQTEILLFEKRIRRYAPGQ